MNVTLDDLVIAGPGDRLTPAAIAGGQLLKIRRGVYLPRELIPPDTPHWQVASMVTQARALSLTLARKASSPVVTMDAALMLHGIDTWLSTADVVFRSESKNRRSRQSFPSVRTESMRIARASERRLFAAPSSEETIEVKGVRTAPLWMIAGDCARFLHPMQAFAAVSGILRRVASFDRNDLDHSRLLEGSYRQELHLLNGLERPLSGNRQARAVIAAADAGSENPGEAFVLWLLHCMCWSRGKMQEQIETQIRVDTQWNRYFGDIGFPLRKVIVEFDGASKIPGNERKFLDRQRDLLNGGWTVIRVGSSQLDNPAQLIQYLTTSLVRHGIKAGYPQGPLWKPLPAAIMRRERRH